MDLVVCIACGIYLAVRANHHWIPHDEGTIAQAALRTLEGELPHRDFDELYSGGLTFLHAAAFDVLGVQLTSLRIVLLVFSFVFLAAFYRLAVRVAPPVVAGLATLVAVSWTLPNYFASMPSWYNLFFAVFGTLALCRYQEGGSRASLVAAGACAGASFAVKSVGLYFLAAGLLFLVHFGQERALASRAGRKPSSPASVAFVVAGLLAFAAALVALVARRGAPMEWIHYAMPGVLLAAYLGWREQRIGGSDLGPLLRDGLAYLAGTAIVVACFLAPFVATGSVGALIHGVFVAPASRFQFAFDPLPPLWTLSASLPLAALACVSLRPSWWRGGWWPVALVLPALGVVLAFGSSTPVYRAVWFSARPALPWVVLASLAALVVEPTLEPQKRLRIFLASAVAAMVSLVQFPLSFGLYFCFAAATIVFAWFALTLAIEPPLSVRRPLRALQLGFLVFYGAFPLLWMHRADFRQAGIEYRPIAADARLDLPRAGLEVQRGWKAIYEPLVAEIQRHTPPGSAIYAFPDAPEVYFLAERENPTRTFFDFFNDDGARRITRFAATVERHDVDLVVLNQAAHFSPPPSEAMVRVVAERFPHQKRFGPFLVAWRDADPVVPP